MWFWANDITTCWARVPNGTLSMMFAYCPNFLAPLWPEIFRFQTSHFADFEQFKVDIHFANFGQVKIGFIRFLLLLCAGHSYFTEFRQDMPRKTIQIIQEPRIGSGASYFEWFRQWESRAGFFSQKIGFKGSVFCFFL